MAVWWRFGESEPARQAERVSPDADLLAVRRRRVARVGALGVLAVTNLVAARRLGRSGATAWNLAATAGLLGLARYGGASAAELGLDRRQWARGVRVGGGGLGVVAAAFGTLATRPSGRAMFTDDRTVAVGPGELAAWVGVHIPVGTVLFEEVAFRGVLPALLADPSSDVAGESANRFRAEPSGVPVLLSCLLFGAWHILSAGDYKAADPARAAGEGAIDPVLQVVLTTTAAGGVLWALRRAGGHLIAPSLVHAGSNILATLIGRAITPSRR